MPPDGDELPDDVAADPEGRGETAEEPKPAAKKKGRKRSIPSGRTVPRKFVLTEEADERLWQTARKRKTTVSAIVNQLILQRLPKCEVRWDVRDAS